MADIIDLDERRKARLAAAPPASTFSPMWCYVWMPVYYWYL